LIRKELEISVTSSSEESNDSASFYSTSCYASKYQQQQQQNITWPNICFNTTLNSSINFLPQYQTPLHQLQQQQQSVSLPSITTTTTTTQPPEFHLPTPSTTTYNASGSTYPSYYPSSSDQKVPTNYYSSTFDEYFGDEYFRSTPTTTTYPNFTDNKKTFESTNSLTACERAILASLMDGFPESSSGSSRS